MRRFVIFVLAFCAIVCLGALAPQRSFYTTHNVRAAQLPSNWSTGECDNNNDHNWGQAHVCQMRRTTFALAGGHLSVETQNGGIDVTGEDRSDVALEARVRAWGPSESAAREILNQVAIETAGGNVRDHGPKPFFGRSGYNVDYHLHVPRHLAAELHTVNGGIALSRVDGEIRFNTTNGGVDLSDLSGDVQGKTVNGGLDIALSGDSWHGEGLHAETMNGGVDLRVPADYSAHLESSTVNGGISIDFPITIQGEIKNHLDTDLGHGGPTVHVQTVNGGVSISHSGSATGSGE